VIKVLVRPFHLARHEAKVVPPGARLGGRHREQRGGHENGGERGTANSNVHKVMSAGAIRTPMWRTATRDLHRFGRQVKFYPAARSESTRRN
jgi:hypothetical protein